MWMPRLVCGSVVATLLCVQGTNHSGNHSGNSSTTDTSHSGNHSGNNSTTNVWWPQTNHSGNHSGNNSTTNVWWPQSTTNLWPHTTTLMTTRYTPVVGDGCWFADVCNITLGAIPAERDLAGYDSFKARCDLEMGSFTPYQVYTEPSAYYCAGFKCCQNQMTCGDVRASYKNQHCCGNPAKTFELPMPRRLSTLDSQSADDDALAVKGLMSVVRGAHAKHGEAAAKQLAAKIMKELVPYL